jgi:hypothetical protein
MSLKKKRSFWCQPQLCFLRLAFRRSAFGVWRLAFGVWCLGFGGWGLGVGIRRLAFGGCGAQEALAQEGEAAGRVRLRPNRGSRLAAPDNVTPTKSSSGLFENKDEDV